MLPIAVGIGGMLASSTRRLDDCGDPWSLGGLIRARYTPPVRPAAELHADVYEVSFRSAVQNWVSKSALNATSPSDGGIIYYEVWNIFPFGGSKLGHIERSKRHEPVRRRICVLTCMKYPSVRRFKIEPRQRFVGPISAIKGSNRKRVY